jgi:hypothetical protein
LLVADNSPFDRRLTELTDRHLTWAGPYNVVLVINHKKEFALTFEADNKAPAGGAAGGPLAFQLNNSLLLKPPNVLA